MPTASMINAPRSRTRRNALSPSAHQAPDETTGQSKVVVTTPGQSWTEPQCAFVVWRQMHHADPYKSAEESSQFVTVHEIVDVDGRPTYREGRPIAAAELTQIVMAIDGPHKVGWCDPTHLFKSPLLDVWWVPPTKRSVLVHADKKESISELGGLPICADMPLPGLVYAMTSNQIVLVLAFKGGERPTPDTELFSPPLLNVAPDGQVCFGTAQARPEAGSSELSRIESMLWDSHFAHKGGSDVDYEGGICRLWRDLLSGALTEFPEAVLKPSGWNTLGSLVAHLSQSR